VTAVEILYFAGCPAYRRTRERVLNVVRDLRLPWQLKMVLVRHERDARDLRFHGSPTVRVDGADIDPAWLSKSAGPGLYCRPYRWKNGEFDAPPEEMLREVFAARRHPR
jgi:hypothetical protein